MVFVLQSYVKLLFFLILPFKHHVMRLLLCKFNLQLVYSIQQLIYFVTLGVKGCDLRDCGQKRLFRFHDVLFLQKVLRGKPFDRLPACAEFECDGSARAERGKLGEKPRDVHRALIERRVQIADTVVVV